MFDLVARLRRAVEPKAVGLAAAAIALAVGAVFAHAIFSAQVFYAGDIHGYWYPYRAVIERALAEPALPLWNAHVGFGVPLLADPSVQLLYPPTWLGLLLPAAIHYKLSAIGHTLLAAAGAWLLARRLGGSLGGALVAALGYGLAGPLLSAVSLFHHHAGAAWIPWVLWALEGLLRGPGLRPALTLGIVGAAQILAGSGDMCLFSALLGTPWIAWRLLRKDAKRRATRLRAFAPSAALAAVLALALGAAQWLPTAELVRRSGRVRMDRLTASYWSLHPASLADLAVPRLVSALPLSASTRELLYEGRAPLLGCIYLGVVPLALGLLALFVRTGAVAGPAFGATLLLLLSLGRHLPFTRLLWELPGLSLLRYPQKLLIPAALCVALLAAFGFSAWTRPWSAAERRRGRWAASLLFMGALGLVATAAWLAAPPGWLSARLSALPEAALEQTTRTITLKLLRTALLVALAALLVRGRAQKESGTWPTALLLLLLTTSDLVVVGHRINDLAPAALLEHRPAAVALAEQGTRVHATNDLDCLEPATGPAGWKPEWTAALGFQDALRPPSGARWGLFGSYDGEFTGLGSPYSGLLTLNAWNRRGTPAGLRLLQLADVGRVLHVGRTIPAGLLRLETLSSPYVCPLQVLRVPGRLPRAYVVRSERQALGPAATLAALVGPGFEPAREVVLEVPIVSFGDAEPDSPDEVGIVSRTTNTLELRARLVSAGTLVVVEAYAPGWRASVDGRPAPLLRANGLFRGVRLGPGEHRVRFAYRPRSAAFGALSSLAGLVALLALAAVARRRPGPGAA